MPREGHKSLTIRDDAKELLEKENDKTGVSQAELARKAILEKYGKKEA